MQSAGDGSICEGTTDLPEQRDWKNPLKDDKRLTNKERENYDKPGGISGMTDREYWNKRSRGMGGSNGTSCAEENLLGYEDDRYFGENIFVHEFSHTIFFAIKEVDPGLYAKVEAAYHAAKENGLYKGRYAINTLAEYWAEGTQWWFGRTMNFTTVIQEYSYLKTWKHTTLTSIIFLKKCMKGTRFRQTFIMGRTSDGLTRQRKILSILFINCPGV